MKQKFKLYKNLILVAASALTLIAVTFAWFSVSYKGLLPALNADVGGNLVDVTFMQDDGLGNYSVLNEEISIDNCVPGSYNQYKMIVKTKTADPVMLSFNIDDIPTTMPAKLRDSVCVKYVLKKTTKQSDGSFIDGTETISASTGYVPLSTLNSDGTVFGGISLESYQSTSSDYFVIYYEIGLSVDSPTEIRGLSSALGSVNIAAQRIG